MTREEFFTRIEVLLGTPHPGQTIGRGRWRRGAGTGRYPGRGVIRYHSEASIHVILHTPTLQETFSDGESALCRIKQALTDSI